VEVLIIFLHRFSPSTPFFSFDKRLDWSSQERIFTVMIGNLISRLGDPSEEAFLGTEGGREGGRGRGGEEENCDRRCQAY